MTSSTTSSGGSAPISSSARAPSTAERPRKPEADSRCPTSDRTPGLSSTTSTRRPVAGVGGATGAAAGLGGGVAGVAAADRNFATVRA